MNLFEQIFAQFDAYGLETFIDGVKEKHGLKGNTKEISQMIVEALKTEAIKRKNNNMCAFGFDDARLEASIIKADTLLPKWKASKDKKEIDNKDVYKEKEAKAKKPRQTDEHYFNKKGQKHTKKAKKESEDEFDYTQLELF